jgi:hypothetical protein
MVKSRDTLVSKRDNHCERRGDAPSSAIARDRKLLVQTGLLALDEIRRVKSDATGRHRSQSGEKIFEIQRLLEH